jgi:hypothetical protein
MVAMTQTVVMEFSETAKANRGEKLKKGIDGAVKPQLAIAEDNIDIVANLYHQIKRADGRPLPDWM